MLPQLYFTVSTSFLLCHLFINSYHGYTSPVVFNGNIYRLIFAIIAPLVIATRGLKKKSLGEHENDKTGNIVGTSARGKKRCMPQSGRSRAGVLICRHNVMGVIMGREDGRGDWGGSFWAAAP